ncbi:MAG: hypothetical protein BWY76_01292 [bacterium ADurb.Bin429]|nr:MAG: hypothetical protein BWY76_01292 [bacterium ADurb.Bin429]
MSTYDIAAFYWPAYHDEPRWRAFMPEGIGEWETIRKAKPKTPGQYQPRVPLWGYESEADPTAMAKKIDAAADHGVNTFIFDWYWYENRPFLEDALTQGFFKAPNNSRIRFYLMWANHDASTLWDLTRSERHEVIWPGAVDRAQFDKATDRVLKFFLKHPSYYTIDGKPVFAIYELGTLINGLGGVAETREALDAFREKVVAAGFPGLHLQAILWGNIPATVSAPGDATPTQNATIEALGFDSLTNYQWCHYVRPHGDYAGWAEKAVAAWEGWSRDFSVPFFPHVSIGWDTNPRYAKRLTEFVSGGTPERFAHYLRAAKDFVDSHALHPKLLTINAWNEWSEGSYLEPDTQFEYGYLEAVKKVFCF